MRRIDAGTSGGSEAAGGPGWEDLGLGQPWRQVLAILDPGPRPRAVQSAALGEYRVLHGRRNLIVSAPTNSGKSLVGLLVLLEAVRRGRRAVLLEPLRAIAREKADELQALAPRLGSALGRSLTVRISTGDYRLEDEAFAAPPPDQGEIIIATPERFDAIFRNPDYDAWVESVGAVCVDEAHLVASPHRGPTLEYLLTALLCKPSPPRLALLSATLGDADRACEWLAPCDLILVTERSPALHKEVLELTGDDEPNAVVVAEARECLADAEASLLVFVYQTRSAERLASTLSESLGKSAGPNGAVAYHAQMSAAERERARSAYRSGLSRCLVATTALGLGVNLPATHVIVRDTTFVGSGPLSSAELLQMMGRAGRGEQPGWAAALVRPNDDWSATELASALRREDLPPFESCFRQARDTPSWREADRQSETVAIATHVASQLSRYPEAGRSLEDLEGFFVRSLGGQWLARRVQSALQRLSDPRRALAYRDEQEGYHLTALGLKATRAVLPLDLAGGVAQLIRDLLTVDREDGLLARWRPLDSMLVLELLHGRGPSLRRFSEGLAEQVDGWMEQHPSKVPLLYREWIVGAKGGSHAEEVLGSLGVELSGRVRDRAEAARRMAYLAAFRSIVLFERGMGTRIEDLARRFGVTNLGGVEERWRDNLLWLLSGLGKILEVRCFYYHLREACDADAERVRRIERLLKAMRIQILDLQEHLKYCSPLGPVLRSMRGIPARRGGPRVGIGTIRRLEEAGVTSMAELAQLDVAELVRLGVRRDLARRIRHYVRARLR